MLQILCGPDRTANSMRILDQICENARPASPARSSSSPSSIPMRPSARSAPAAAIPSVAMRRF